MHCGMHDGAQAVFIENKMLRIALLPGHGGKIASLYLKKRKFELLFQNPKGAYRRSVLGSEFSEYEACGFDDAFPTVNAQTVQVGGKQVYYPDHGEIWSAEMPYTCYENRVELHYDSRILPCSYEKTVWLAGCTLHCKYKIINTGKICFPFLWVCHCLVRTRRGMELILPESESERVPVFIGSGMRKWYIRGRVSDGCCGYLFPDERVRTVIEYDAKKLPYLGFWQTDGGYRGDFNCALEPATGFYDDIETAMRNNACNMLRPGERFAVELAITLQEYP